MEKSMFLSEIDSIREEIITKHYESAKQELKEKVRNNPLKSEYILFESEPLQIEMATEIAKRLLARNKCVTRVNTSFFSSLASISVKLELPTEEYKVETEEHKVETEESKTEETETETQEVKL